MVLAVMSTVLIMMIFHKSGKTEKMIRDEVELEHLQKDMPAIKQDLAAITARYDSVIGASRDRYNDLETKKQPIQNAINKVRPAVHDYTKEQFRDSITVY